MAITSTRRQFLAGATASLAAASLPLPALAQSGAKTVTTSLGTYDIPTDPQRIVLMGNRVDLETALALGIRPVGMGREYTFADSPNENVAPWVDFDPAGIEVFDTKEVSAEQILALEPDLILMRGYTSEWYPERYAALSSVIPHLPTNMLPWREDLSQVAEWLGRGDALAATFAEHDAARDALKAKHAEVIATRRVAFGSVEPPIVWLCDGQADVPAAQSLRDFGGQAIPLPQGTPSERQGWASISPENLGLMSEADAILLWAPTRDILDNFVATNPLWERLPQVQAGRAILAPNNVGSGSIYTVMETLRLWDEVYSTLA